jgi:hypothetical protein
MKSRLTDAARRSLHEDVKRMTAEQRPTALLSHCQLMAQLADAGGTGRHPPRDAVSPTALAHPGQSPLLMADIAELLARRGVRYAVIRAIAAAPYGVVRVVIEWE